MNNEIELSIALLKELISTPSFSKEENGTATAIELFFIRRGLTPMRKMNNVWCANKYYDPLKPTLLLNSHHDTVKPNHAYTLNPYEPLIENGKFYGLGSNDAGASLVSLLTTFLHFYHHENLAFNIIYAATAEEEISGKNGIELLLTDLGQIDFGIVGEPTNMRVAVAEKGLLVLDCEAIGIAGHAAREEGVNAIYEAMKDIHWFSTYDFPKKSEFLGPIKMSVTMINAGTQHNVIPSKCNYLVDVRITDQYSHDELLTVIRNHVKSEVIPRSLRLNPSHIDSNHPLVLAANKLHLELYGSPTLSDQSLMDFPTIKLGPGDPKHSHIANEFICLTEIPKAINTYINLLYELNTIL